jgi:drug/metabolite transporter (DMT)-like permease
MLLATIYALTAAVLHAGWNLIAKRAIDPFLALWGQFLVAGAASAIVLTAIGGLPAAGWGWALLSGIIHVPYVLGLSWAYRYGDFSLAYPVARGGGALIAAIGGLVLLDDQVQVLSIVAIVVIVGGMALLAVGAPPRQVIVALLVAVAIGSYTVVDSHAARRYGSISYVLAVFVMMGVCNSVAGVIGRRLPDLRTLTRAVWWRTGLAGIMSVVTYGLVLLAVRRAPVGYVAALRESSVLIATVIGWRMLDERRGRIRTAAAGVIVTGLVLLVIAG